MREETEEVEKFVGTDQLMCSEVGAVSETERKERQARRKEETEYERKTVSKEKGFP